MYIYHIIRAVDRKIISFEGWQFIWREKWNIEIEKNSKLEFPNFFEIFGENLKLIVKKVKLAGMHLYIFHSFYGVKKCVWIIKLFQRAEWIVLFIYAYIVLDRFKLFKIFDPPYNCSMRIYSYLSRIICLYNAYITFWKRVLIMMLALMLELISICYVNIWSDAVGFAHFMCQKVV